MEPFLRYNVSAHNMVPRFGVTPAVAPGEGFEFTEEEVAAGLGCEWSDVDPRAGLAQEREFKRRRDAQPEEASEPAESGEQKEEQPE